MLVCLLLGRWKVNKVQTFAKDSSLAGEVFQIQLGSN